MARPDIPDPEYDGVPSQCWVIRIPKTGSGTLVAVCGPISRTMLSHSEGLDDVLVRSGGTPGAVLASVRHPVDRFRSAFDMYQRQGEMEYRGFESLEEFVDAGPAEWHKPRWGSAFWSQTYWLKSIEHIRRWGVTVLYTPQMDQQLIALKVAGWPIMPTGSNMNRHDAGPRRSLFTDPTGKVREWYAPDLRMLEALGYE